MIILLLLHGIFDSTLYLQLHSGHGLYDCTCESSYHGDGLSCTPILDHVSWDDIHVDNFVDMHSIHNVTHWKHNSSVYHFKVLNFHSFHFHVYRVCTISMI